MMEAERQTHTRTTLNKRTDQPPRTDYQEEKPIDLDAAYLYDKRPEPEPEEKMSGEDGFDPEMRALPSRCDPRSEEQV